MTGNSYQDVGHGSRQASAGRSFVFVLRLCREYARSNCGRCCSAVDPVLRHGCAIPGRPCGDAGKANGFTLLELMVVLVIVGLMSTAVVLTAPGDEDVLAEQAARFGMLLARAREEAILSTRAVEVTATAQGYGFVRQSFGGWQPLRAEPFGNTLWPATVRPVLGAQRRQAVFHFDPTGAATVEILVLAHDGRRVRITVDAAGKVRIDEHGR